MTQQQPQSELYNQNNPYLWPRSKCCSLNAHIQHAATKVTDRLIAGFTIASV